MLQSSDVSEPSGGGARASFPIAAVGASAGGLAPTVELVRELGARPGIGIVVIHHLAPTHESGLVEILSRATAMPVVAASDGVRLEPNRVYVVPPNAGLLIGDGALKLVPRVEKGGLHLPIDRFCESLAQDRDRLAIAVVLSGSGFDGTEGVKAIKREGGITLAQDATAPFRSMPQSAIATGCIDFIQPPAGLARELTRIGAQAASPSAAPRLAFDFTTPAGLHDLASPGPGAAVSVDPAGEVRSRAPSDVYREADRLVRAAFAPPGVVVTEYLESVIEQLEATNEELKAANEEIVSSNEELRSTNAELQSAKEELQATNEELRTLNDEIAERNVEATRLSDDLANVFTSIEIPILIVGRDLRLRKFTPAAGRVFGVLAADLGRSVSDVPCIVAIAPALTRVMGEVLEQLRPANCTIQDAGGRWHDLIVRPYVMAAGRIDGIVMTARDVDGETKAAQRLAAAQRYAENIVETVREGLVVLDRDLRVRSANAAFRRTFRLSKKDFEGRRLDELGRSELAAPALRKVLKGLADGVTSEAVHIEQSDGPGGARLFLVNARPMAGTELALVSLEDVTEAEHSRRQRVELAVRDALTSAGEGILMVNAGGRVLFANLAAAELFGYESEELVGLSTDLVLPDGLRGSCARHDLDDLAMRSPRSLRHRRDTVGRRKDGTEFPVEVSLSPMVREGGPAAVAFVTDVTERRRAEQEIRAYQEQLQRMAFDAVVTEERERRRIAIELHDRIGQDLALAKIKLDPVRGELSDGPGTAVVGALELIEKAIDDTCVLVFELSPPVLYDLGLKEALAWLADDVEKRYGITAAVTDDGSDKPLDDSSKAIVFRGVRELLMNVLKHAQAPHAQVSLRRVDDELQVDVQDRGVGFDPLAIDRMRRGGFGLLSVREQIARLGGTLKIESAPGAGTIVSVRIPLQASESARRGSDRPPGG